MKLIYRLTMFQLPLLRSTSVGLRGIRTINLFIVIHQCKEIPWLNWLEFQSKSLILRMFSIFSPPIASHLISG